MESSFQLAGISILRNLPVTIVWLFGIVLAVLMVRRGAGRAEKLLLAGCSLMFIIQLATPLLGGLIMSLGKERGLSNAAIAQTMGWVSLPLGLMGLAGLVCLVWAFWVRFRGRRQVSA